MMKRRFRLLLTALVLGSLAGCSSDSPTNPANDAQVKDAGADSDAGAKPDAVVDVGKTLYGGALVEFVPETHSTFLATFFAGPLPPAIALDLMQEQAGCRLMVPRNVACSPACGIDAICTGVNVCTPRPMPVDVGVLHVEGVGDMSHDLTPTAPTVPVYQIIETLPYPACKEGDDIKVGAKDFALSGKCIAPLVVTSKVPIPVMSGQPMHIAWTPPGRSGISRVELELEISHHGGFKGQIECDVADTGSFDIPAPLITELVGLGRAGYPTIKVVRNSTAHAATQAHVSLGVRSQVELSVDTGVVSCGAGDSPPCATGTMCQPNFTCAAMK